MFNMTATIPVLLTEMMVPIQFGRNLEGVVESVRVPLDATIPPITFTNKYFVPRTCGYPAFTEKGVIG
jgi:hypothetical protein